jgi:hypothetical protein
MIEKDYLIESNEIIKHSSTKSANDVSDKRVIDLDDCIGNFLKVEKL